jgi:hypothetical protein
MQAMIDQHCNAPSVIAWVTFNEGWGQYDTARITDSVRSMDPTRLVDSASGWNDRGTGDLSDVHAYPGPWCPASDGRRACVLGEFGGLGYVIPEHAWTGKGFGYRGFNSPRTLGWTWFSLWKKVAGLRDTAGLCAAVYTQTSDVEEECNGFLTYDRRILKVDAAKTHDALADGKFPPKPIFETVGPRGKNKPATWKYTLTVPAENWFQPTFDDSGWKNGAIGGGAALGGAGIAAAGAGIAAAGAGGAGVAGAVLAGAGAGITQLPRPKTDLYLRREWDLPAGALTDPVFLITHGERFDLYFNGVHVAHMDSHQNEPVDFTDEARRSIKPGRNVVAVHARPEGDRPIEFDLEIANVR